MKTRRKTKPAQKQPRIVYSKTRALIPLDTEKLRKKELSSFKRVKTTHEKLNAQLTQFEKKDVPEFQKWMHTHCGPIREQFQSESMAVYSLQNIFFLAQDLCEFYSKRTEKECLEAAQHYTETKGDIPKGFEAFFAPPPEPKGSGDFFDSFDEEDCDDEDGPDVPFDELRNFMNELFGEKLGDEAASFFDPSNPNRHGKTNPLIEKLQQERKTLKKLYRSVVQKLHPDRAGSSTPEQQELWHAAKHAYTMGDIQTLQHIEAQCDLAHKDRLKFAAVSSIRSGILFYKRANDKIRYEIRKVKRQPEWGFSSRPEERKIRLVQQLTNELKSQVEDISFRRKTIQRRLDQMKNSQIKRSQIKRFYNPFQSEFF